MRVKRAKQKYKNGIQASRIRAGFKTAEDAAKELGIPYGTYRNYEQGDSFPKPKMIPVLADLFRCSIDDLYGYQPKTGDVSTVGDALKHSDMKLFERVYDSCSLSKDHDLLMTFVMVMAGDYKSIKFDDLIELNGRLNTAMSAVDRRQEKAGEERGDPEVRGEDRSEIAG